VSVEYLFIDTVILCGLSAPGGKGQPEPPRDADPAAAQLAWIAAALAASTADWLVVAGHYAVYSVAEHGSTACLVQQLKPLLEAHKVAAYVNGHDHNLQHIEVGGVAYVTLGPGHDVDADQSHASTVPAGGLVFYGAPASGGFASFTFYNKTTLGVELYEAAATPRVAHAFSVANPRAA
jgi:tartrate-resistant acid phosphatase type 5